eukprot:g18817.t1
MMLNSSTASSDVPQRKTVMTSSEDRIGIRPIGYPSSSSTFPGVEKLRHVLHSLQHIIDDDEHLTKIFPMPPLLTFKQPPNLKLTIVCSKLPSVRNNIDHNTIQPCHGNLWRTCQIFDMDTTITHGNTPQHVHGRYS